MIIDCVSDLHGHYPELEGGDLLIVGGDLTRDGEYYSYIDFCSWLESCNYTEKIVIAGNHDNGLSPGYKNCKYGFDFSGWATYLCDSGTKFSYYPPLEKDIPEGTVIERKDFKIWGSPWTRTFEGMNHKCKAFTCDTEGELDKKWALIPDDIDILITHSPPWGILDKTCRGEHVGSKSSAARVGNMENPPKLWVWGHIHESYGIDIPVRPISIKMINASHVNERYEPVNKPIRVEL